MVCYKQSILFFLCEKRYSASWPSSTLNTFKIGFKEVLKQNSKMNALIKDL